MKKILFKKRMDLKNRIKAFSIRSRTEDVQCKTQVKKSFRYAVDRVKDDELKPRKPLVFIRKSFNTKKRTEEFSFHVKGYFYATHKRKRMKVRFYHTLDIKVEWKAKYFSPHESVDLT